MSSSVILATAGYDHKIRFWEAPTGACTRSLRYPDSQVNCLQITPDKQFIAAGGNPHIRLFEVASNANPNPVLSYDGHTGNVMALGFQKEGKWMYSCSEDGTIRIWDLRAPGCQRSYECRTAVNSVVLHPNQAELISGDQDGKVRVWDLTSNNCIYDVTPEPDVPIRSVSVAGDASLVVAGTNEANLFAWRPVSSKEFVLVHKTKAHSKYLLKCAISPDSQHVVTTSADKTAKLWSTETWEVEQTLKDHQRWVWDAVFSADSSYLVTACSDHQPRLWDLRTGELVRAYQGHSLAVTCVALNDCSTV